MDLIFILIVTLLGYGFGLLLKRLIFGKSEKSDTFIIKNYYTTTKVENHLHISDEDLKKLISDK